MEIAQGTTYYLEILITDKNGDPVTGLSVTYKIYKSEDNSLVTSGSLTDIGEGVYQNSYTFNNLGQYRILYFTPNKYSNEIETILVVTESISSVVQRILGLVQENFRIFDPVYDSKGNMQTCLVKIYNSATDTDNDNDPIAQYRINATHNSQGFMTAYKSKRIA